MALPWGQRGGPPRTSTIDAVREPPADPITCECGEVGSVPHGERWTCPSCGRGCNTSQIPADAYRAQTHVVSRYRLLGFGPLVVLAAVMVPLVLFVDASLIFLLGILAVAYILLFLPFVRRRVRRGIAERTRLGPACGLTLEPLRRPAAASRAPPTAGRPPARAARAPAGARRRRAAWPAPARRRSRRARRGSRSQVRRAPRDPPRARRRRRPSRRRAPSRPPARARADRRSSATCSAGADPAEGVA